MGDSDFPDVPKQLAVFAREISELYRLERSRNAELDDRIEELTTAILRHLAADHDESAEYLRDALKRPSR
jgi:hypothetical protein